MGTNSKELSLHREANISSVTISCIVWNPKVSWPWSPGPATRIQFIPVHLVVYGPFYYCPSVYIYDFLAISFLQMVQPETYMHWCSLSNVLPNCPLWSFLIWSRSNYFYHQLKISNKLRSSSLYYFFSVFFHFLPLTPTHLSEHPILKSPQLFMHYWIQQKSESVINNHLSLCTSYTFRPLHGHLQGGYMQSHASTASSITDVRMSSQNTKF